MRRSVTLAGVLGVALCWGWVAEGAEEASPSDAVPPALLPFEHLIGGWKGTSVPKANPLKGWTEKHTWAWKFSKGQPVGMTVKMEGSKQLAQATLTYDADADRYRLEGTDAAGKEAIYLGALDANGKFLPMDREGGKERLTFRLLPDNKIRYIVFDGRKEPGSPKFMNAVETGLTKDGESLGGSAAANDGPKCIVTGGAAGGGSVSFEGKTYPICCTGCRDEFNDNPAKYVKKALLRAQNAGKTTKASESTALAKDDGSFEGLTDEAKPKVVPKATKPKPKGKPDPAEDMPKAETAEDDAPATKPDPKAKDKPSTDSPARAVALFKQAQALEKLGKTDGALGYYRRLVADFPDSPQAKPAAARIKALTK